ncbi:MAG: porin family protein [Chitinophagales bacterium]|nr:PorT family protein [Chitinophagales bacterium]MDW8393332.1 porin family protein [Chitinophagales bacterium]
MGRPAAAQYNVYGHNLKYQSRDFHFGIALGVNLSNYKITMDSLYLQQGEITVTSPITSPGFSLGIISSLHLSNAFELRFIPDLAFADRSIRYSMAGADSTPIKRIESVYLEFPVSIKYRSKPYRDFRLYVTSGFKYSIDMQSNATARLAENLIKVYKHDIAFEYGLGGEFHLPLVTVAPEIKVSYGLMNILKPDPNLVYARVLDRLRARTFMIAIHFEG